MDEIWPDGFFWPDFPDGSRAVYAAYAAQKTGPGTRPGFYNREMLRIFNEEVEIVDNTFITITEFLGICVKVVRKGVKGLVENRFIFDGAEEHDTMEYYAEFLSVVSGYCISDCINSFRNNKRVLFSERQILKKINKIIKLEKECDDEGRYEFFSIWGYVKVIPEPFAAFVEVWNGQTYPVPRLKYRLNWIVSCQRKKQQKSLSKRYPYQYLMQAPEAVLRMTSIPHL